jgi:cytochrome c oxidase assembly factor CtaG
MPAAADLPLAIVSLFAALHVLGEQRTARMLGRTRSREDRRRAGYFYVGLLVILGALVSPIDTLAEKLFWVHMLQHVMLLSIAAPLIVLGAPWMSIWRPLPLGFRRTVAKGISRSRWASPLRILGRSLARPKPAWIAFSADLIAWHIPAIYDLAVQDRAVHDLEHATFLLFGILLWAQVLDSPPLRTRLSQIARVYYIASAAVVGWLIALVLIFATSPLYPFYERLTHRPGGISALADQQLAGGIMLVLGGLSFTLYVFFQIYVWIGGDQETRPPGAGVRAPRSAPTPDGGAPPVRGGGAIPPRERELVGAGVHGPSRLERLLGVPAPTKHHD